MQGEKTYANPRNFASGTLRQLDSAIVASRKLDMFPYDVLSGNQKAFATHFENFEWLKEQGFNVNPYHRKCENIESVIEFCNEMLERRDSFDYEIDGVVVKVNSTHCRTNSARRRKHRAGQSPTNIRRCRRRRSLKKSTCRSDEPAH